MIDMMNAFNSGLSHALLPCAISLLPITIGSIAGFAWVNAPLKAFTQLGLFLLSLTSIITSLAIVAVFRHMAFGSLISSKLYFTLGCIAFTLSVLLWRRSPQTIQTFLQRHPAWSVIILPILLGGIFGFSTSPCGTAELANLLTQVQQQHHFVSLISLDLWAYFLGQSSLLLVIGLAVYGLKWLAHQQHNDTIISRLSSTVWLMQGILLTIASTGKLGALLHTMHLF